jgi:hypothetical protein
MTIRIAAVGDVHLGVGSEGITRPRPAEPLNRARHGAARRGEASVLRHVRACLSADQRKPSNQYLPGPLGPSWPLYRGAELVSEHGKPGAAVLDRAHEGPFTRRQNP